MQISNNTLILMLAPGTKVENVCSINQSTLYKAKVKVVKQEVDLPETKELIKLLLSEIPPETNPQLEADTKNTHETVSVASSMNTC